MVRVDGTMATVGKNNSARTMRNTTRTKKSRKGLIKIENFNVMSARGIRLETSLQAIDTMNVDLSILTETNLQGYHTKCAHGYDIEATREISSNQGGIAIASRSVPQGNWHMEGTRMYVTNVMSTVLTSGWQKWTIIAAYLLPSRDPETELVQMRDTAARYPHPAIVIGDLNCRMQGESARDLQVISAMESIGSELDLSENFRIQRHFHHRRTWRSHHRQREAKCDYILGTDRRQ